MKEKVFKVNGVSFPEKAREYGESFKTGEWFENLRIEAHSAGQAYIWTEYVVPLYKENEELKKTIAALETAIRFGDRSIG